MNQKKWTAAMALCGMISCILTGCKKTEPEFVIENFPAELERFSETGDWEEQRQETEIPEKEEETEIVVHICGAVNQEMVISLPEGSRVFDAVTRAGGLTGEADQSFVNLAEKLSDGEQIYIPTRDEVKEWEEKGKNVSKLAKEKDTGKQDASVSTVNINTAGADELCTLPGIGESRAASIIAYREENGAFQTIEDIMCVSGIKEAAFGKIKDRIVVSD